MNLLVEISAKSITKAIKIDTNAIERFERKNESEYVGTHSFMIPPKKIIGNVPIKIDLYNLLKKKE